MNVKLSENDNYDSKNKKVNFKFFKGKEDIQLRLQGTIFGTLRQHAPCTIRGPIGTIFKRMCTNLLR